jgi:hypothetical protein
MLRKIQRAETLVVRLTMLVLLTIGAIQLIVGAMLGLLSVMGQ